MIKKTNLYFIAILFLAIVSCSKDDDVIDLPTVDDITEVVIAPTEVRFNEIGQTQEFTANAYNKEGLEIGAKFSWTSSNTDVVAIRPNGIAAAISPGSAKIYVTVNEVTDSADVTVDLDVDPSIWWVSAKSGNWNEASNWSTGVVPSATDTVGIMLEGDYTVTLSEEITIAHLILGAPDGTQRLATGTNQLTIESGTFTGGAEIQVDGTTTINGEVEWKDGDVTGSGTLDISNSANIMVGTGSDSKIIIKTTLLNSGKLNILPGVSIHIDGAALENLNFASIDMMGDNISFTTQNGGTILNNGNLGKSAGSGTAYFHTSGDGSFVNRSYLFVQSGILNVRDGKFEGVIDIEQGAVLRQTGYTLIKTKTVQRGDGEFEIGGRITLGEEDGEVITLRNVVLESSYSSNSINGPGVLRVSGLFLWYNGTIAGEGEVFCYGGMRLKGSGWKEISQRTLIIEGDLETESLLDLRMSYAAQIRIETTGHWTHNGGGLIKQGVGDKASITINDTFTKKGTGSFTVETDFTCSKTMELKEGALTVTGAFELTEEGTIIGGGTDISNESKYRRLQVPEATSAILAGTIDLDADGEQAYMSILGAVSIAPSFKVLVEVNKFNSIPAERLVFTTGNIALDGTLAVTDHDPNAPQDMEYQVVETVDGTGAFNEITGASSFNEKKQNENGVFLIKN